MSQPKQHIRALITGAGSGASGNLIRALQGLSPKPYIVGVNHDRFVLKLSLAECNYLSPDSVSSAFVNAAVEIIKRERINLIAPTDDQAVKVLSDNRVRFPVRLLLPCRRTIDMCQDKYALNVFLRRHGIPAPETYSVNSLRDIDRIFFRLSHASVIWCRSRYGSRALGAIPVSSVEQARTWITQWRDLQQINVSDFTLSEYLPGRHFIVPSVWCNGSLLHAQATEVLDYFAAGNNPSGIFSLSCLAKTVAAVEALEITLNAVRAIEPHPSGVFSVELKESSNGKPAVTEINAGRFPAGISALLAAGKDNMIAIFASAVLGQPIKATKPHGSALEYYLIRDIDAIPKVFARKDILNGMRRVDTTRSSMDSVK